jgi:4-hydroxy-3-methylbut-2-en-1-yl diphosphate reductase
MNSLNLQVRIDPRSGLCPGVNKAVEKAEAALQTGEEIYCLGDIVHNDEEIKRLEGRGLVFLDHGRFRELKNKTVLFRAHGEPPSSYALAAANHNRVIDASCPVVLNLQQRVWKARDAGEHILIYGKKGHPEVIGLLGHAGEDALVANDPVEIDPATLPQAVTLFCQTTQPVEGLSRMIRFLENAGVKVRLHNTICQCVSGRYPRLKTFAAGHEVLVFVGGQQSSNARALFDYCKEVNPHSHFVSRLDEVNPGWFKAGQKVGVTGSASTPLWQLKVVAEALGEL